MQDCTTGSLPGVDISTRARAKIVNYTAHEFDQLDIRLKIVGFERLRGCAYLSLV